ncbi:MAG: hypothetical protein Q9218_006331 [Villophora microphyllina]
MLAEVSHPLRHRRSSTFSDSIDDARSSIKSSTDDLLLPRAKGSSLASQLEPSHWHSTPLALALLPAVGGILFQNGSAIVTDITLLGLAAIFLNWSVRLPWEWYHSAQSIRPDDVLTHKQDWSDDTIIEEDEEDEQEPTHHSQEADPVAHPARQRPLDEALSQTRTRAAKELRAHELLALFACFLSPILGGWLLHAIRSQLSRPSEGLVSNYNLTVFLLASEVRPLSHLIKMIQARTLYLQRTVGAKTSEESHVDTNSVVDMAKRINELEAYVAQPPSSAASADSDQIKRDVRNSLQPDLDALNRAVRRYEKKLVALTMQTESRLQELEARMSDAITLAAAAERSSTQQRSRRGSSALILYEWVSAALLLPVRAAWAAVSFPAKLLHAIMRVIEEYLGSKVQQEMKTAGRASGGHSRKSNTSSTKAKKAISPTPSPPDKTISLLPPHRMLTSTLPRRQLPKFHKTSTAQNIKTQQHLH